jgi:hypothetical protein
VCTFSLTPHSTGRQAAPDNLNVEGYSAELDPYAQENGVLKNKFGISDFASLNEV